MALFENVQSLFLTYKKSAISKFALLIALLKSAKKVRPHNHTFKKSNQKVRSHFLKERPKSAIAQSHFLKEQPKSVIALFKRANVQK